MAKKTLRAMRMLRLVPVALTVTGVGSQSAIALETPGNTIVSYLGQALDDGYLHGAQQILDTVFACGVTAVVIGDLTLTVQQLDGLISDMASGDQSGWAEVQDAFQSVREGVGATFITNTINVDACVNNLINVAAAANGTITETGSFSDSSQQ